MARQSGARNSQLIEKVSNFFCADAVLTQSTGLFPPFPQLGRWELGTEEEEGGRSKQKKKGQHIPDKLFVEVTLSEAINTRRLVQDQGGGQGGGVVRAKVQTSWSQRERSARCPRRADRVTPRKINPNYVRRSAVIPDSTDAAGSVFLGCVLREKKNIHPLQFVKKKKKRTRIIFSVLSSRSAVTVTSPGFPRPPGTLGPSVQ